MFYQAYQSSAIQRAEPSISVRGFSGSYVGFFIDGIPVNATYGRTDWGNLIPLVFLTNFISNNEHRANLSVGGNLGTYYYQVSYAFAHRDSYNLFGKIHSHFAMVGQWRAGKLLSYKSHFAIQRCLSRSFTKIQTISTLMFLCQMGVDLGRLIACKHKMVRRDIPMVVR